jgi:CYTH domain-containing protein
MPKESTVEIEIERRWLPKNNRWKQNTDWSSQRHIKQAYPASLQTIHIVGRVRCTDDNGVSTYVLEYKSKVDNDQTKESKDKLNKAKFDAYLAEAKDINLTKWRCDLSYFAKNKVELGIKEAIIDTYVEIKGNRQLNKLNIIEVEFTSVEAARKFVPPADFGKEITGKTEWSNYQMCLRGVPQQQLEPT